MIFMSPSFLGNETDKLALLDFKRRISNDPQGVLNSWNSSEYDYCRWQGITCGTRNNQRSRVTSLNLRGSGLGGTLSPYIGNLTFLTSIELGENRFYGEIPPEIGRLLWLNYLNLSSNLLNGEIPTNISSCSELRFIDLRTNEISGKIPNELSYLKKLEEINLGRNSLTGEIPRSFGNLSSLQYLSIATNNLEGNLPIEISLLRNLSFFSAGENRLTGSFPTFLFNISSIKTVSLTTNLLEGNLPLDIGLKMKNLERFAIGANRFYGNIPVSIGNASKLQVFDIPRNKFEGLVPSSLGNLPNLLWFNAAKNLLGENSVGDLDFVTSLTNCTKLEMIGLNDNNLGGELPRSIGNLSSTLQKLFLGGNKISGTIPVGLGNLVSLYTLALELNSFSGVIPNDFVKFRNIQLLSVGNNFLSGPIPSGLDNITTLFHLHFSGNSFNGSLPLSIRNLQNLKILNVSQNKLTGGISPLIFGKSFSPMELDLSHNLFTGAVPDEVGTLEEMHTFDVSFNEFSGKIPDSISDCSKLEQLYMQNNHFSGFVPPRLSSLKAIRSLDLSQNNLTGKIPRDLEGLTLLKYLNLSFNNLEGEIPVQGVFSNASQAFLAGNSKICGGISELSLPPCSTGRKKKHWKLPIIITMSILGSAITICVIIFSCRRKKGRVVTNPNSSYKLSTSEKILRVSYHQLYHATEAFSSKNLVGSGSFGSVYKGKLNQQQGEKLIAVKVLHLDKAGASKSFETECRALRNIRHRNLVPLLTYCSSIDLKGNQFKALVYEFMENGNLHEWLHMETDKTTTTTTQNLEILQRLNIAIDVASALQYLHHDCESTIVHCDLKPSNILLKSDLTALVGDFGLARLVPKAADETYSNQGTSSTTIAIKGSIGYAAPGITSFYLSPLNCLMFCFTQCLRRCSEKSAPNKLEIV